MKIYNLNIDTSAPVNQTVPMQQSATGLLNLKVTNGGKNIRNLTTKVYDGGVEVPSTEKGFKVEVGTEPKHVKVVASSTPLESSRQYIASYTPGTRTINKALIALVVPAGTYRQDEFMTLVDEFGYKGPVYQGMTPTTLYTKNIDFEKANFDKIQIIPWNPQQQLFFQESLNGGADGRTLPIDELLVVTEDITFYRNVAVKTTNANTIVISSETYPAIGYYTDYQIDTLVKPSDNAPYDGNYVEPLTEVEVDGVKFVPTTLTIDGVDYKVLAEAVDSTDSELDSTDTELDSTDSEVTNGDGE